MQLFGLSRDTDPGMPQLPAIVGRSASPSGCASVPRGGPAPAGPPFTAGIPVNAVKIEGFGPGRGAVPGHSIYRGHRWKALGALIIAVPGFQHAAQDIDLGAEQKAPHLWQSRLMTIVPVIGPPVGGARRGGRGSVVGTGWFAQARGPAGQIYRSPGGATSAAWGGSAVCSVQLVYYSTDIRPRSSRKQKRVFGNEP